MTKKLFILFQYVLPHFLLTHIAGWIAQCRWVWLKNKMISHYIHRFNIDMRLAHSSELKDYACFNDFFTRALKPEIRPIENAPQAIISPVDGCISQLGKIDKDTLAQAKGCYYSLNALLGGHTLLTHTFHDGHFITLYLSPKDYHRVHLPLDGKLLQTIYVPGKLFSVNSLAAEKIPQLFSRNERLVCIFDTPAGPMAAILIGAMIVGKIQTIWGLVERSSHLISRSYTDGENIELNKGDEMGRFLLGSSVILLFSKDKIAWDPQLKTQASVIMGQRIGSII